MPIYRHISDAVIAVKDTIAAIVTIVDNVVFQNRFSTNLTRLDLSEEGKTRGKGSRSSISLSAQFHCVSCCKRVVTSFDEF